MTRPSVSCRSSFSPPPAGAPGPGALPDLPTTVGLPGYTLEREVGGHICLATGVPFFAARR